MRNLRRIGRNLQQGTCAAISLRRHVLRIFCQHVQLLQRQPLAAIEGNGDAAVFLRPRKVVAAACYNAQAKGIDVSIAAVVVQSLHAQVCQPGACADITKVNIALHRVFRQRSVNRHVHAC